MPPLNVCHGRGLVIDSAQREQCGALGCRDSRQTGDVRSLIAAIVAQRAQTDAAARLPQLNGPVRTCAVDQATVHAALASRRNLVRTSPSRALHNLANPSLPPLATNLPFPLSATFLFPTAADWCGRLASKRPLCTSHSFTVPSKLLLAASRASPLS